MRKCKGIYYKTGKTINFTNGIFHGFFQEGASDGDDGEYYPVAVVELEDGKVVTVVASQLEFVLDNKEVIERKEPSAREIVTREILSKLGFPAHLKGYDYIKTALDFIEKDDSYLKYITKGLYPDIAKKFGATSSQVERAIRHIITKAWETNQKEFEEELLITKIYSTNSQFLAELNNLIKLKIVC